MSECLVIGISTEPWVITYCIYSDELLVEPKVTCIKWTLVKKIKKNLIANIFNHEISFEKTNVHICLFHPGADFGKVADKSVGNQTIQPKYQFHNRFMS